MLKLLRSTFMYRQNFEILKPKDVALMLGVTTKTLREWDKSKRLVANRTVTDRRYYTRKQIYEFLNMDYRQDDKTYIYARVSTANQKPDLDNQVEYAKRYCQSNGIEVTDVLTDISSGLNYKRKSWMAMMRQVENREVKRIVVASKDRFVRFGFEWFDDFCKRFGCELMVIEESDSKSPEQEMVEDLISIIHSFSCRIYGLRKYMTKEDMLDDSPKD